MHPLLALAKRIEIFCIRDAKPTLATPRPDQHSTKSLLTNL